MERSSVKNNPGEEGDLGAAVEQEDKPVHALRSEIADATFDTFAIICRNIHTDTDNSIKDKKPSMLLGWRDSS